MPEPQHATITAIFDMPAKLVPHLQVKLREVERDVRCELIEMRVETNPVPISILEAQTNAEQILEQHDGTEQEGRTGIGTEGERIESKTLITGEDSELAGTARADRPEPLRRGEEVESAPAVKRNLVAMPQGSALPRPR